MKKYTILLILALTLVNLAAFEAINPAGEMSGKYLRFASYNQKSFLDIDDGFNKLSLSIAKPHLYKAWSLSSDANIFGDDIYSKFTWNINPAYTLKERYTFALTMGMINQSFKTDDLIFGEAETISSESVTKPTFGASFNGKFVEDKLELKVLTANLNQPELALLNDSSKENLFFEADLAWKFNNLYKLGLSYKNEDQLSYFGVNFDVKFPYPSLKHNLYASTERVTYNPTFSLINYWQVGLAYDLFWDSELGNQNLELDLIYQYTGKQEPVVETNVVTAEDNSADVSIKVTGADRFRSINTTINNEGVINVANLWDDDSKDFTLHTMLIEGDNEIVVTAVSVDGTKTVSTTKITLKPKVVEIVEPEVVIPVIEEIAQTEDIAEVEEVVEQEFVISDLVLISIPNEFRSNGNNSFIYKVREGDNLWSISKQNQIYGDPFKWKQLHLKNGLIISDPDLIYPGQLLYIENNSTYDKLVEYDVLKGDNIWDISHNQIKSLVGSLEGREVLIMSNQETILKPSFIEVGQKLLIKIYIVK